MPLPYAEEMNYWKSGKSSPDVWIDRAKRVIESFGGRVVGEAFGAVENRASYMIMFDMKNDHFRVTWPVLESKSGNTAAARIQAATLLYHDVKNRCIGLAILGVRAAFMPYLLLDGGKTMMQLANPEIAQMFPILLGDGK